jgi:hypothetical protein
MNAWYDYIRFVFMIIIFFIAIFTFHNSLEETKLIDL